MARRAVVLVVCSALAGCSGAGGSGSTGSCSNAQAAATGPGDASGLFPASVGDVWAYGITGSIGTSRSRVEVTGPAVSSAGQGVRFVEQPLGVAAPPAADAIVAVGPGGVTVLESGEWDALSPALRTAIGAHLLLRFPVTTGDAFVSTDCHGLDVGSVDGDASRDTVDLRSVVTVVGQEPVATPAGDRNAFRIETRTSITVHGSAAGNLEFTSIVTDWYASGLGLLKSTETVTGAGMTQTAQRTLQAWSVGGDVYGIAPPQALVPQSVQAGEVVRGGWQRYQLSTPADRPLVFGLLGATGPVALWGAGGANATAWSCISPSTTAAMQCVLPAGAGAVALDVDGGDLTSPSASFGVFVAPQPTVVVPVNELATMPLGVATSGQVATRGSSTYTVTGLTPGVPVVVALLGATGAADLRPAPGGLFPPSTCWLDWSTVVPTAESCTLTPASDTAAFDVDAGPLNRDGAAFLLVAWQAPQ